MKIKNSIKLIVSTLILSSFIYSGSVTPVLGLRFNDIAGSTDLQGPSQTLGLKMDVGSGVFSGFDTNDRSCTSCFINHISFSLKRYRN